MWFQPENGGITEPAININRGNRLAHQPPLGQTELLVLFYSTLDSGGGWHEDKLTAEKAYPSNKE